MTLHLKNIASSPEEKLPTLVYKQHFRGCCPNRGAKMSLPVSTLREAEQEPSFMLHFCSETRLFISKLLFLT